MRYSLLLLSILTMAVISGCGKGSKKETTSSHASVLSIDSLMNASIDDDNYGWISLRNWKYTNDTDQTEITLSDKFTMADLNGDGYMDAIGSLAENTGGSGTFVSLVVFLNEYGHPLYTASFDLGDRIEPDSIVVVDSTINLYYMDRSYGDPMSEKGTVPVHKKLKLNNNALVEIN